MTVGTSGLLALLGWLGWQGVPILYRTAGGDPDIESARRNAVAATRAVLLAGFVGVGALGTFWVSRRVYRITTARGQFTDRYTTAVEQLESPTLAVRLVGIHALEQLAHDSTRGRDQAVIVEVLSAFVRVHSDPGHQDPGHQDPGHQDPDNQDEATLPQPAAPEPPEEQRRGAAQYIADLTGLPVDVEAAATVLGHLPVRSEMVERAALSGARLSTIYLVGANLTRTVLMRADLTGANLAKANLTEASLYETNLTRANLRWAMLTGADLAKANLTEAQLVKANLTGADLEEANLTGADLYEADLTGANLHHANLTGANLDGTNLTRALVGTDLTGVRGLSQAQLDAAFADEDTSLPAGLRGPGPWPGREAVQPR